MARKQQKIKAISYVRVNGELVETSQLNPEQKKKLATWLKITYLNHLYAGKAKFYPLDDCPDKPGMHYLDQHGNEFVPDRGVSHVGKDEEKPPVAL